MATSRRNNLFVVPGTLFATGLLGMAHGAPAPCDEEIVVENKSLDMDYRNNNAVLRDVVITQCDVRIQAAEARVSGGLNFKNSRWTISGDVRINSEGGSLRSDKAIVSFADNLISRATITGAPAEFEQLRDDGTTARGKANTIDYETTSGSVSFTTGAWLSYGRNEITGQQLVYNIRTQSVQGQSRTGGGSGDGRVRIVIQPDKPITMPDNEKEKKP
ncbi:MAG TPA: lipopolysaccharide transport periplasmic protein LptA [Steroidobacteraceae bacterium]|nr:lipopolysaccharide transport periplasmic protein LptA [Steroidobacteraceae bacterium]